MEKKSKVNSVVEFQATTPSQPKPVLLKQEKMVPKPMLALDDEEFGKF